MKNKAIYLTFAISILLTSCINTITTSLTGVWKLQTAKTFVIQLNDTLQSSIDSLDSHIEIKNDSVLISYFWYPEDWDRTVWKQLCKDSVQVTNPLTQQVEKYQIQRKTSNVMTWEQTIANVGSKIRKKIIKLTRI